MINVVLVLALALAALLIAHAFYLMFISFTFGEESLRADETHMVETVDGWQVRLARYKPEGDGGEPVLLVPGACGNQFSLASPAGDSIVDVLRERGFDCWIIDLRGTRSSQAPLGKSRFDVTFDDYLQYDLPAAIDFIRRETGFRQVHWVGHSMGGMLLYAYELMHTPKFIASGATIAAPPGFANLKLRRRDLLLSLLSAMPGICEMYVRAAAPLIPALRLNGPIKPVNWQNMHEGANASLFYNMLEVLPPQVADTLSLGAANHQWRVNDGHTDVIEGLKKLQVPLLCVYGINDCFIPEANARIFFEALPTKDKKMLMLSEANGCERDYGHVDVILGKNGRDEVYGPVADWFDAHSIAGRMSTAEPEFAEPVTPVSEASWRKALRRAADVMSDFDNGAGEVAAEAIIRTTPEKTKAKTAPGKAAAKRIKAKSVAKKKAAARKKKIEAEPPAKKPAAKKKFTVKKKAAANSSAKKPAAKKKTRAKKKAASK